MDAHGAAFAYNRDSRETRPASRQVEPASRLPRKITNAACRRGGNGKCMHQPIAPGLWAACGFATSLKLSSVSSNGTSYASMGNLHILAVCWTKSVEASPRQG